MGQNNLYTALAEQLVPHGENKMCSPEVQNNSCSSRAEQFMFFQGRTIYVLLGQDHLCSRAEQFMYLMGWTIYVPQGEDTVPLGQNNLFTMKIKWPRAEQLVFPNCRTTYVLLEQNNFCSLRPEQFTLLEGRMNYLLHRLNNLFHKERTICVP